MKYFRVKVKRDSKDGGTHYTYPAGYDATKVKVGPTYETFNPGKMAMVRARGAVGHEFCLIAVSDADAAGFTGSPDVVSVDETTFLNEGEVDSPPEADRIDDQDAVLAVLKKVRLNTPLNAKDREVIDPSKGERGIGRAKGFRARFTEFKTANAGL